MFEIICLFKVLLRFIYSHVLARAAGFLAALGSVDSCAPNLQILCSNPGVVGINSFPDFHCFQSAY